MGFEEIVFEEGRVYCVFIQFFDGDPVHGFFIVDTRIAVAVQRLFASWIPSVSQSAPVSALPCTLARVAVL